MNANSRKNTAIYDILDDIPVECFQSADSTTLRIELSNLMAPSENAGLDAYLPLILEMHPELDEMQIKAAWPWKIKPASVIRHLSEKVVAAIPEDKLPAKIAEIDHAAFNRMVEIGVIAFA
jgi:hypothetical protein